MSGRIKAKETGFFAVFAGCNEVFGKKKPVSDHPCVQKYMKFIGIDLGWSSAASGLCCLNWQNNQLELTECDRPH
ncbi:hypothetical protein Q5691_13345 [Microcoleus sp. w1-18aA5]|uniref:hypothetical protein n=1 Tax=unclassified Microcoleus TaxID=2642155 RepID=UPI002FCF10AE